MYIIIPVFMTFLYMFDNSYICYIRKIILDVNAKLSHMYMYFILECKTNNENMICCFLGRLTQKERHDLEQEYIERMRSLKRKRETVPHRETHEMMMGGQKVLMFERYSTGCL